MAQRNTVHEAKAKLAKTIRDMVDRVAGEFADLEQRERVRQGLYKLDLSKALQTTGIMDEAHAEPGAHEAVEPGVAPHQEPGQHEQFVMNPPATPDMAAADPVGQGTGVPPGQMEHDPMMDGGTCPLCQQPDAPGSCQCLAGFMGKNDTAGDGGAPAGVASGAPMAMSETDPDKKPECPRCGITSGDHRYPCTEAKKSEANPGANKDPSKKQPTKPVPGAVLPPEKGGEKIGDGKGSGGKPKENPLGKGDVPMAKPPSGKVPGQTAAPIASNTSKPGLNKGALNPQMKQHAMIDASKAAAGKPAAGANPATAGVGGAKTLTNPNDMSRANSFAAAGAGAFQPKAPVSSGLDLAPKAGPMKTGAPGPTPAPGKVAPQGLKSPTSAARAVPNPKAAAATPPKTGLFGSLFGKSEKCPFCQRAEHPGDCTSK